MSRPWPGIRLRFAYNILYINVLFICRLKWNYFLVLPFCWNSNFSLLYCRYSNKKGLYWCYTKETRKTIFFIIREIPTGGDVNDNIYNNVSVFLALYYLICLLCYSFYLLKKNGRIPLYLTQSGYILNFTSLVAIIAAVTREAF